MIKVRSLAAFVAIAITISLVVGLPVNTLASDISSRLSDAEKLLEAKDYAKAKAVLEPMVEEASEKGEKAQVRFLLGRVLYENSFSVISANRVDGKVKFKDITPSQVTELKAAVEHFQQVVEIDPDGKLVPDAYFMLGKVWDYDCLQKFGKSKKAYGKAGELSPDTQMSKDAASCVERLDGYFSSHGSSH